ncbi:hypothetical protein JW711_06295 [Candidatus Woesearchaeota archaeon]|nr:hypothetical protein [Candidatus Woesearchaeota archaeon]
MDWLNWNNRTGIKNRRAQINQAFIYLAAILVIGAIAVIGAKGIGSMLSASCEAKNQDFRIDVLRFIDEYADRGSVHFEVMAAPCDAKEVCFTKTITNPASGDAIMDESAKDGTFNIFIRGEFTTPLGLADKLDIPEGLKYVCVNATGGYFNLKFSGTGRTTVVERGVSSTS